MLHDESEETVGGVLGFRMNTVVFTASPQNTTGIFFTSIMQCAMPTMVGFRESTTLFCCGEYGAEKVVKYGCESSRRTDVDLSWWVQRD